MYRLAYSSFYWFSKFENSHWRKVRGRVVWLASSLKFHPIPL